MKKLELIEVYEHPDYVIGLDIEGNIIVRDAWFNPLFMFFKDAPLDGVELCFKAIGFRKVS